MIRLNEEVNKETEKPMAFSFQKQGELIFSDANDKIISKINIEIADNEDKRMTGLMFRDKMNENQGMLFFSQLKNSRHFG